jgi:hypothetical protein
MNNSHLLRYQSMFNTGRSLSFPCAAEGHVLMDLLSERTLLNYLYVQAVVGRRIRPALREP